MIIELGHIALCFAFVLSLLQSGAPWLRVPALGAITAPISAVNFMLITSAFAALIHAYAVSDFTVLNVILNSHSLKPLLYKITGSWGNHEGSMILWVWVLALFGFLVALTRHKNQPLKRATLQVLGALNAGFLAFILFTSNPFVRVFPPPMDGEDLNPLLQDVGLAIHPPMLYLGYVGFGVVFAYAIAGMWRKEIDAAWARAVHPWILGTWAALTAGIGLGSWWAYRELGWGGWWFWDPVENVALLPWLTGGALMHANMVLAARGNFVRWVALLAILSFSMSLIGTFIVRSGLITSAHAFASDPERGMFILAYIAVVTGGALALFARWNQATTNSPRELLLSRAGLIAMNNVILVTAAASILLAILYPLFLTLAGLPTISVGPPYFNAIILPLCAPLLLLAAVAPLMPWQGVQRAVLRQLLLQSVPVVAATCVLVLMVTQQHQIPAMIGSALGAVLLLGLVHYALKMRRALPKGAGLRQLPARRIGSLLGHTGLALFAVGLVGTGLFKTVIEAPLSVGESATQHGYSVSLQSLETRPEKNYLAREARIEVRDEGAIIAQLTPETRLYPVRDQETTEAALSSSVLRDIVAVVGRANYSRTNAQDENDVVGVRIYIIPLQWLVWLGFILASLGSMLAAISSMRRQHA